MPLLPVVNRDKCCGYGVCAEMCPDVFALDDQGFAYVKGPAPEGMEEEAREAGESCPEEAVTFEES